MTPPVRIQVFRQAHWMLFGLVLCLSATFWLAGQKFGKKVEETYRDPHRLAALKTFEQAIVLARPGEPETALGAEALKDKFPCAGEARQARLAGQLQTLAARLRSLSQGSGRSPRLSLEHWPPAGADCGDVLEAAAWLAEGGGRRLEAMDWPGLRKDRFQTVMRVPDSIFLRDNPWRGADGCVYLGPAADGRLFYLSEQRGQDRICPAMAPAEIGKTKIAGLARRQDPQQRYALPAGDPAWAIPEDLGAILADLNRIRRPEGVTYGDYTAVPEPEAEEPAPGRTRPHGPNRLNLGKREIDVGFSVYLTLVPAAQALVQSWARCYAGDAHACEVAGLERNDPLLKLAREMYEAAAVRMAAVALVDVASGRIEALGSAHTECYEQDHDGPGHDPGCPDAPFRPRYDPDRLLNHAVYVDALPASTIKPIMALGFLEDNAAYRSGPPLEQLQHDLKTSNSANFLDRLFCGRELQAGQRPWQWRECRRPRRVQEAAGQLGWNPGCAADRFSADCGKLDILFGRPAGKRPIEGVRRQPMGLALLYGRLFAEPYGRAAAAPGGDADAAAGEPEGGARLMGEFRFEERFARECSAGGGGPGRWRRCKGLGGLIANEGWGQGEARATPLGVAGMLARLAAAANGAREQAFPHLVDHIGDAAGRPFPVAVERFAGPVPVEADPALAALIVQGMTSHRAGGTAHSACLRVFGKEGACEAIDWIAGKTGTPPFGLDRTPLSRIRPLCAPDRAGARGERCNTIPYKWYVAAFKTRPEPGAPYDKALAILTERNWRKKTQLVQAPGDSEVNLSAELALRIIKALRRESSAPAGAKGDES